MHQVRWVEFGADEFLCIASQRGLQLYTADGKRVLHSHPPPPGTGDQPAFFRGIAGVAAADANYICAGTSTGELHLIPQAGATFGQPIVLSEGLVGAITDACGGSVPGEGLVAAADASCKITAYLVSAGGEIGLVCQFENPGSLCTSVRMRRHWLLAAHATGHVASTTCATARSRASSAPTRGGSTRSSSTRRRTSSPPPPRTRTSPSGRSRRTSAPAQARRHAAAARPRPHRRRLLRRRRPRARGGDGVRRRLHLGVGARRVR